MAPTRTLLVLAVLAALLFSPSLAATGPPPGAPNGEYYSFFNLRSNFVLALFHHEGFCCSRAATRAVEHQIFPSQFTIRCYLLFSMLLLQRGEVLPLLSACLQLFKPLQKVLLPALRFLSEVLHVSHRLSARLPPFTFVQ